MCTDAIWKPANVESSKWSVLNRNKVCSFSSGAELLCSHFIVTCRNLPTPQHSQQHFPQNFDIDWIVRCAVKVFHKVLPWLSLTCIAKNCFVHYRKRGSASYIVREVLSVRERERDTERDRRKWRHHCRAKIGDEFTLSLAKNSHNWRWAYIFPIAKNSHFSFLTSHFPSLPSRRGHHCGAEIRNEFTLSFAKFFLPSLFPLFQMARAARRVIENPRQMIKSCPVLFCSSHRKNESN